MSGKNIDSGFNKYNTAVKGLKLPRLFSDGIILQREKEIKIWGWAPPGETVEILFKGKKYRTKVTKKADWELRLPPHTAGGPYSMNVSINGCREETVRIKNILIGEVWVCSGQSNMELPVNRVQDLYQKEIAYSENPEIRQFKIETAYDFSGPRVDLESGEWIEADPESVLDFSATAYFFARELYKKYQIPVGLINCAVGGSPVEAWISEEIIKHYPGKLKEAKEYSNPEKIKKIQCAEQKETAEWYKKLYKMDRGLKKNFPLWAQPEYNSENWALMEIPTSFAEKGLENFKGVIWFRKEIQLNSEEIGQQLRLQMGTIVDSDWTYINGQRVGQTEYRYPPRKYELDAHILKPGKNIIALRVVSNNGEGGFIEDKPYQLELGNKKIDLKGEWKYRVGAEVEKPLPEETFFEWKPVGLYNALINPLTNYAIKGVIWYQGESNVGQDEEYRDLFPALIKDWRQKWNQGKFPFLFVQLPNYGLTGNENPKSSWARMREAQCQALSVPHTAMVVAIDLGEWNDLHPVYKKEIGERLALAARSLAYGEDVVYSGPLYNSKYIQGKKVVISFEHVDGGLTVRGSQNLCGFEVAGPDGEFLVADAEIKGEKVIVWHEDINHPVRVRYAWADNPEQANLYNKAGFPAAPFRTD